jgi:hypothetical protein
MLKLIEQNDDAEQQARSDMEQDAPNDRAVQVFREEIARSGNPHLATVRAMDAWLWRVPARSSDRTDCPVCGAEECVSSRCAYNDEDRDG